MLDLKMWMLCIHLPGALWGWGKYEKWTALLAEYAREMQESRALQQEIHIQLATAQGDL